MSVLCLQRSLNETYKGGVGSYLLFVMCLSFLQQHRVCSSPSLMGAVGMGHLVFDFLQLYGRDFNFDTTAVSVRNGGSYFPKVSHWRPFLFSGVCFLLHYMLCIYQSLFVFPLPYTEYQNTNIITIDFIFIVDRCRSEVSTYVLRFRQVRTNWFYPEKPGLFAVESPLVRCAANFVNLLLLVNLTLGV